MEDPDNHQENEEEIRDEVLHNHEEDLVGDSDASDYEWERQMQEIWQEFDEAYVENHVEKAVEEVKTPSRLISDEELKFVLTHHVVAKAA